MQQRDSFQRFHGHPPGFRRPTFLPNPSRFKFSEMCPIFLRGKQVHADCQIKIVQLFGKLTFRVLWMTVISFLFSMMPPQKLIYFGVGANDKPYKHKARGLKKHVENCHLEARGMKTTWKIIILKHVGWINGGRFRSHFTIFWRLERLSRTASPIKSDDLEIISLLLFFLKREAHSHRN